MKIIFPFCVPLLLTLSCTRYQFLTIQSSDTAIQKNAKGQFIAENDSLVVTYDFKGVNIPLGITIANKLDKPVKINWKQSSVIINDKAFDLMADETVTTVSGAVGN